MLLGLNNGRGTVVILIQQRNERLHEQLLLLLLLAVLTRVQISVEPIFIFIFILPAEDSCCYYDNFFVGL